MIAEDVGTRTGVIVALMHCLWSVAGRNRGAVAEFDAKHAKLFAHVVRVPAEQVTQLRQALVADQSGDLPADQG